MEHGGAHSQPAAEAAAEPGTVPIVLTGQVRRGLAHAATQFNDYAQWSQTLVGARLGARSSARPSTQALKPMDPEAEPFASRGTPEQRHAWRALCAGENVCILGPGGTGKSQFIQWARDLYLQAENAVVVTASTANAAYLLGGVTVHRMAGLPVFLQDETKYTLTDALDRYIKSLDYNFAVQHTLRSVQLWVCDEISMISPRTFHLVDLAMRYVRQCPERPFGGCQFLWSGDFLQIPPVVAQDKRVFLRDSLLVSHFLFSDNAWLDCWRPLTFNFCTNKRARNADWSQMLARVRMGRHTGEDLFALAQRTQRELRRRGEYDEFVESPALTRIYPTNAEVKRENDLARERLALPDHEYPCTFSVTSNLVPEWTAEDAAHYDRWSMTTQSIPRSWYARLQKDQRSLTSEDPWLRVFCRSLHWAHALGRRALASDDECFDSMMRVAERFLQDSKLPTVQQFRVGEKVRMTVNIAQTRGLVNGAIGRVAGFLVQNEPEPWQPEWLDCSARSLKRFIKDNEEAFEDEEPEDVDPSDAWARVLVVDAPPLSAEELAALRAAPEDWTSNPCDEARTEELGPFAKVRALWYGSTLLRPSNAALGVRQGQFLWTDRTELAHGLPVVEWAGGLRTVVPYYDWTLDYSSVMAHKPQSKQAHAKKDKWQIHAFGLPLKTAYAMTYHDCQGQTCERIFLGGASRLFSASMLYVGLSRAPSLESVALSDDFQPQHIVPHPHAIKFFEMIEDASGSRPERVPEPPRTDDGKFSGKGGAPHSKGGALHNKRARSLASYGFTSRAPVEVDEETRQSGDRLLALLGLTE